MTIEKPGEDASAKPLEDAQDSIDQAKAAAERARDVIEDPDYAEQAETGEELQEEQAKSGEGEEGGESGEQTEVARS